MKFTEAQLKAMGVKELKARLKEINTEAEAAKAEEKRIRKMCSKKASSTPLSV